MRFSIGEYFLKISSPSATNHQAYIAIVGKRKTFLKRAAVTTYVCNNVNIRYPHEYLKDIEVFNIFGNNIRNHETFPVERLCDIVCGSGRH